MANSLTYKKATAISLREHPQFTEKWLQERIGSDPSILGLGDLELISMEIVHPKAGRLDLLLRNPETERRFVTEIQLGATDPSHIIRTIEYWDLQSRRYPQYDHCAVLVAEDITSRFLNVIAVFNRAIPFIAVQLNALQVDDSIVINCVTVLDHVPPGDDDGDGGGLVWGQGADRAHWEKKPGAPMLPTVDACIKILQSYRPALEPRYNRQYIGQYEDGAPNHCIKFFPRKQWIRANVRVPDKELWRQRLADTPVDVLDNKSSRLAIQFTKESFTQSQELLRELFKASCLVSGDDE